jgi:hypothetical protein
VIVAGCGEVDRGRLEQLGEQPQPLGGRLGVAEGVAASGWPWWGD